MGQIHPDHVSLPQAALFYNGEFNLPAKADAAGRPVVRGEDQLLSHKASIALRLDHTKVGAGTYTMVFPDTPATEIHKVLFISVRNNVSVCSDILLYATVNRILAPIGQFTDPIGGRYDVWQGEVWLDPGDKITILFEGCQGDDPLRGIVLGKSMTKET